MYDTIDVVLSGALIHWTRAVVLRNRNESNVRHPVKASLTLLWCLFNICCECAKTQQETYLPDCSSPTRRWPRETFQASCDKGVTASTKCVLHPHIQYYDSDLWTACSPLQRDRWAVDVVAWILPWDAKVANLPPGWENVSIRRLVDVLPSLTVKWELTVWI